METCFVYTSPAPVGSTELFHFRDELGHARPCDRICPAVVVLTLVPEGECARAPATLGDQVGVAWREAARGTL